jgi:hypothetical protein
MIKRLTLTVLAMALAAACARTADVDTVAVGTDVVAKQTNGVTVTGKLVSISPDHIVIDEKNGARRTLDRRAVSSVAAMEIPLTPQPNAAEAAARADAGVAPPVPSPTSNVPTDHREPAPAATSGRESAAPEPGGSDSAPVRPAVRQITLPAGTILPVRLETSLGSDSSHVEDTVRGTLTRAIRVGGAIVIPAGSTVIGSVTSAVRPGKVKGRSYLAMRFHTLVAHDDKYTIRTATIARRGRATKKKDAATIGIPAAGGAVVGGIIGGKKGAAIGGAAGGGAGTAVVLNTRGEDVRLPRGTAVSVRLTQPVLVTVS